jgi:hypothetical protein
MNSDCRQMIDVCKPRVYHDNIFHLTGLPVDASSRDIARRQDDLKAAEVSGDWKNEFRHVLMRNEIPTPENLRNAFVLMQDPERRLIDEFFWFWPLEWGSGKKDPALQHLLNGSYDAAIETWQTQQYAPGRVRMVSQHNLAVFYHFYAIDRELAALSNVNLPPAEFQQMADHWQLSFSNWESLAGDDDFWGIVTERIRVLNDPRLTTGFARRMRQAFPVAFDKINAHLALDYAKKGRYSDARRHVVYMKETHQGLDDVEQTVIEIFEPMEKRVGRMVDFAAEAAKKDPANGLKAAQDLLDSSKESLEAAKGLLDDGHSTRTQLFDLVATTCFGCLIAYGNKTSDWKPCIDLLKKAEQLAVTEDFKKRVRENLDIATQNHEAKILHETCGVCKKNQADAVSTLELPMYGEVRSEFDFNALRRSQSGSGLRCVWKKITLKIPRCKKCASIYRGISPQECTYPPFKELWDKGWKCGKEPSDDEMRKASGLKTRSEEALHKFLSYVAVYGGIGLIIWICSLCGC